ncbi:MAG TPA: hypothetical protein VMZ50_07570, partial [Phycisphaerae bacterium]|nr:hypothetical protein [Phycisphaerae bacterium]
PVSHLAGHLCAMYWEELERLPENPSSASGNPLERLYAFSPHRLHSSLAWHLWKFGEEKEEAAADGWPKARRLWEYRLREKTRWSGNPEYAHELGWFMHWLRLPGLSIDPSEAEDLLWPSIQVLGTIANSRGLDELLEYLSERAPRSPEPCVSLLHRVFKELGARWFFDREHVRSVLEAAAGSTPVCREEAIAVVHLLGEHGHFWAREILQRLRQQGR